MWGIWKYPRRLKILYDVLFYQFLWDDDAGLHRLAGPKKAAYTIWAYVYIKLWILYTIIYIYVYPNNVFRDNHTHHTLNLSPGLALAQYRRQPRSLRGQRCVGRLWPLNSSGTPAEGSQIHDLNWKMGRLHCHRSISCSMLAPLNPISVGYCMTSQQECWLPNLNHPVKLCQTKVCFMWPLIILIWGM